jgi:hypothetical protein
MRDVTVDALQDRQQLVSASRVVVKIGSSSLTGPDGRLGVEDELYKVGAVAGDTVVIGATDDAVVFDWEPTLQAGAELLHGRRGTDLRLDGR